MKFKLVEDLDRGLETQSSVDTLNESVLGNLKSNLIKALRANPDEKYVLHHKHNEKYNPDDEEMIAQYKDIQNAVLIPISKAKQSSGNDLHLLIHYLADHKNELDEPFCIGIEGNEIKKYTIRQLVNML